MAVVLALPYLFDKVVARFKSERTNVPNVFGWRTPPMKDVTGPRIAWVPGDERGGLGEVLPAKQPGRLERSLATLGELFHVVIVSADPSDPENERKQYQATRELFDAWLRAVHLAMPGRTRIVAAGWLIDPKVRRYGAAIVVTCAVEAMIPDVAPEVAAADAGASLDTELLDNTETDTLPEA